MKLSDKFGKIGVGLSFTCAIHCLLMPVFVSLVPILAFGDKTNWIFWLVCTFLSLSNLCWGFKKHKKVSPVIIMAIGAGLLSIDCKYYFHLYASVIGGICFFISYKMNQKFCHSCHECKEH